MSKKIKGTVRKTTLITKEDITTICYGHYDKWDDRVKAVKYFYDCASVSEGAERERYVKIMMELMDGKSFVTDGSKPNEK